MPEIQLYHQGSLASPLVGTPGVNPASGVFRDFAQDIGRVRQTEMEANNAVISAAAQTVGTEYRVIGDVAQQAAYAIGNQLNHWRNKKDYAQAVQNSQIQQAQVAAAKYKYSNAADAANSQIQSTYYDHPEAATDALTQALGNNLPGSQGNDVSRDTLLGQFKNNPAQQAKLSAELDGVDASQTAQMRNWAFTRQKDQVHELAKNQPGVAADKISALTGDIPTVLKGYVSTVANAADFLNGLKKGPIDEANIIAQQRALGHDTGVALFDNLIGNTPSDPDQALPYLGKVKSLLLTGTLPQFGPGPEMPSIDFGISANEKKTALDYLEKQEAQVVKNMETKGASDDAQFSATIKTQQYVADQDWRNPAVQQSALNSYTQQGKLLQGKIEQTAKSDAPEQAKAVKIKIYNQQLGYLDSATNRAKANLQHIDTEQKADARTALAERNKQLAAERKQAADLLHANKQEANDKLAQMRGELFQAANGNLGQNMPAVQQMAIDTLKYGHQMIDAGYLTPSQLGEEHLLNIAKSAADWQMKPGLFWNHWGAPVLNKRPMLDAAKQRAQMEAEIMKSVNSMQAAEHDLAINKNVYHMTDEQNAYYTGQISAWQKKYGKEAPPEIQNAARQLAQKQYPTGKQAAQSWQIQYAKPGPYQTTLSLEDEQKFQAWVKANKIPFDNSPQADYDMRGYWKDVVAKGKSETSVNPNDHQVHFPDTYKTPYHKSFSRESKYATQEAPHWANDHQLVDKHGRVVYDERPAASKPAHHAAPQSSFVPPPPPTTSSGMQESYWRAQAQGMPLEVLKAELARRGE